MVSKVFALFFALLSFSVVPTFADQAELSPSTPTKVDVLIIGAGWAGMAAADYLVRNGPGVHFAVLESTNRTGGRSQAVTMGEYIVEAGSNWIVGTREGGEQCPSGLFTNLTKEKCPNVPTNPVLDVAMQAGAGIVESMTHVKYPDGATPSRVPMVLDRHGQEADPDGVIRDRFTYALDCLKGNSKNQTFREVMAGCGWNPRTDVEFAIDVASTECSGAENDLEMVEGLDDVSMLLWGEGSMFVKDQHPRGFSRIIDEMTKDSIPVDDPRLIFNAHVSNVDYRSCKLLKDDEWNPCVEVTTEDGRVFHAEEIISTIPLGVLQRHYDALFTPSLPDIFIEALSSNEVLMRNVTKVFLQFPSAWWDNKPSRWVSVVDGANSTAEADHFTRWRNLNHEKVLPGSNIILCFLGDPQSSYYEALPDVEVQEAAMKQLRRQHPTIDIPDPINFYMSRHGYDRTRYGAFPVERAPWSGKYGGFQEGVEDSNGETRIRFAGEAFCPPFSGYTHGALLSGISQAAYYLFDNFLGPDPMIDDRLVLCWWLSDERDYGGRYTSPSTKKPSNARTNEALSQT